MKPGNIFKGLPENLDEEVVEVLAQGTQVKIERIVSRGHATPASQWYDQEDDEWVIVLQGEARIAYEDGVEVHLEKGAHLLIPAHTKHRVAWTVPDSETIWLAVHFKA